MSLYEHLGIEQGASEQDIKRAYFRLVRQYTPEKNPDKFMEIRQAYETLSSEDKRNAYDLRLARYIDIPEEVRGLIMEANAKKENGLINDAVRLLEGSEYSGHSEVINAICGLYLGMGKSGKAVNIVKELLKGEPENVKYLRLAVLAYMERGWCNKAWALQETLERLDPCNEENILPLHMNGKEIPVLGGMIRDLERIEAGGKKAPLLVTCILGYICSAEFTRGHRGYLSIITWNDEKWTNPMYVAKKFAEHTEGISADKCEKINVLLRENLIDSILDNQLYTIVPYIEKTINNIRAVGIFHTEEYKVAKAGSNAYQAVQAGIPKAVVIVPLMCAWSQISSFSRSNLEEYRNELLLAELDILDKSYLYIPHIQRLQEEYNEFYNTARDFFELVKENNERVIKKEIYRRVTKAVKLRTRLTLEWLGDDTELENERKRGETIRRSDKIGRNEPCPCGSGKKYKKCCGA